MTTTYPIGAEICRDFTAEFEAERFALVPLCLPDDVVEWIEANIDLTTIKKTTATGLVVIPPRMKEPLRAQFAKGHRIVTLMAIEQTFKSSVWHFAVIIRELFEPRPMITQYQSDKHAGEINTGIIYPLLRLFPEMAVQLDRKGACAQNQYKLDKSIHYFWGAGSPAISHTAGVTHADEIDRWPRSVEGNKNRLRDLHTRRRQVYDSKHVSASSPSGTEDASVIGGEFNASSQEYWHLRCLGCKGLTIPSHDVDLLDFGERDAHNEVIEGNIRLVCPVCKHRHTYRDALKMNDLGAYKAERPDREEHRGFQWGVLAAPEVTALSWAKVAEAKDIADSGTYEDKVDFFNSWRGIPFPVSSADPRITRQLRTHCEPVPHEGDLDLVLWSADTQDHGWYWTAWGISKGPRLTYLISHGFAADEEELIRTLDAEYQGHVPKWGMVDHGGHRSKDIDRLMADNPRLLGYKGSGHNYADGYKQSIEKRKLFIANAKYWKEQALYYLYSQNKRERDYVFFPEVTERLEFEYDKRRYMMSHEAYAVLSKDFENQIAALQPPVKEPDAGYIKWDNNSRDDHYFDAFKMFLVLRKIWETENAQGQRPRKGRKVLSKGVGR